MPGVLGEARDSRGQAGVGAPPSEPARHAEEHGDRRRPARRDSPQGWQLQRPPNALSHSAGYSPSWVWGVFLFLFFFFKQNKNRCDYSNHCISKAFKPRLALYLPDSRRHITEVI